MSGIIKITLGLSVFVALLVLSALWHLRHPPRRKRRTVTVPGYSRRQTRILRYEAGSREGEVGFPKPDDNRTALLPNSNRLNQSPGDLAKLRAAGLPILRSQDELFNWLGIPLRQAVAMANPADRIRPRKTNYAEWTVPKKHSGVRVICSPKPRLKAVQHKIKTEILDHVVSHDAAHGFVRGRGILSNARPHIGRRLVVRFDLRDFFEHVRRPFVVGVFRRMGYSSEVSRWLALLCTHCPNLGTHVISPIAGAHVWRRMRHTVQGAPTSPALANLALHRLDCRMSGLARRFDATYTRYADDLTFSGDEPFKRGMKRFLKRAQSIITNEGFALNYAKARFSRSGDQQRVTGVVVNEKINCARKDYDRLKAILHNAARAGSLASQNRDNRPDFAQHLRGRIAHLSLLNPGCGAKLLARFNALVE